jgi:hypothetical protein
MTAYRWCSALGIALALLVLDASQSWACGWWWTCADGPRAYRPPPPGYGYRGPARAYRYRNVAWAYGYTSPARVYGDAYAAWPSTSIPLTRSYLNAATRVPNAGAVGLTVPITTAEGLREGGLPPAGPSLFGPDPPPSWGYGYYGGRSYGSYYGPPPYGYRAARMPPADTPSWWVEPRRRR